MFEIVTYLVLYDRAVLGCIFLHKPLSAIHKNQPRRNQTTCNVFFLSLFPWNLECSLPKMCFLSARVSSLFFNAFLGLAPHIRKCRNPGQRRTSHRSWIDAIKSLIISLSVAVDWKKRVHWVQWRNVQLRSVAKIEAGINSIKNVGLLSKIYSVYSYCTALRAFKRFDACKKSWIELLNLYIYYDDS